MVSSKSHWDKILILAPIVLFTYNRPWHTQQTVEALQNNELAKDSELFIFSDGGKDEASWKKVNEVREYLKTINSFKKVTLIFQEKNIGLADSIISGVTKIVNQYGKIIVLEDDIVTGQYFLKFMNDALNFYEKEEKVWHISGWNYPIEDKDTNETFLWRVMNCWGWATWKDRWKYFEKNTTKLINSFNEDDIYKFNLDGTNDFWSQVIQNNKTKINTWAIYWYATIFKNNGLCLNPIKAMLKNIGFDSQATHTVKPSVIAEYSINNTNKYLLTSEIIENTKRLIDIKNYLCRINTTQSNKRFSDKDYNLLLETPRFQELEIEFLNKTIKAPDSASLRFLNHELFGLEIYKFKCDKESPLIIDCGANIGLSIIYFKKLFPMAKVIAFEPDKKIFEYLKFNINSFKFNDVELINKGLWKEETTLKFFSEGADGGRIANESMHENIIEIETVKLSSYLNKEKQIDFLKLDIEGAETEVLLESETSLSKVKNIFIEYHSFSSQKQTLSTILSILEKNGFRYYIEHIGVKSQHPFSNIRNYVGFDNQLNIFGYRV